MTRPRRSLRALLVGALAGVVALTACALVAPSAQAAGSSAKTAVAKAKVKSVVRVGTNVPGYCSSPSGFVTNAYATVPSLRLTVTPSSPRAGAKMTVKVAVKQRESTPLGATYPAGIVRGQVVVKVGTKSHVLAGPINASAVSGLLFPKGWTAKATFKAPAKGKRAVSISRIVYNSRGAFNGDWGTPYAGFDVVCSGGRNPISHVSAYAHPRVTIKVRKHA